MSLRQRVGSAIQRAGAVLAGGGDQRTVLPGQGVGVAAGLPPSSNVEHAVGNTEAGSGTRQLWELRPARVASRNNAIGTPHLRAFLRWARVHVAASGETRLRWPRVKKEDAGRLGPAMDWLRDEWMAFQEVPYGARDETPPVLAQQVLYTMLRDGDAFGVPYMERTTTGKRRRRLQVYPGDALAEVQLYAAPGMGGQGANGEQRALGITYDRRGRPITYHFGNGGRVAPVAWGGYSSEVDQVDIPARRVWHFMDKGNVDPSTFRGMPWATSVLDHITMLGQYDRAFIRGAVARAGVAIALKRDPESTVSVDAGGAFGEEQRRALLGGGDGGGGQRDRSLYQLRKGKHGDVLIVEPGYDTANTYPGSPNSQEAIYAERLEKRLSGGLGTSLSTLLGDYKGQNFSSSQQGTLQEKELVKSMQRLLIGVFYVPVYDGFFAERWTQMLMMFPELMPEDEWKLRRAWHVLRQYVALEKHRMMGSVGKAFLEGLMTYAESRDELGLSTADLDAIKEEVKRDHADLGITTGGAAPGGGEDGGEEEGEEEGDGDGKDDPDDVKGEDGDE